MSKEPKEQHWTYDERTAPGVDHGDPEVAEKYDEMHGTMVDQAEYARAAVDRLNLSEDDVLVDFGAGTGTLAIEAAARCGIVFAVDISAAMLDQAKKKAENAGIRNIVFREGGFLTYKHDRERPDAIVSLGALHHLPDFWKAVALKRIYDLLKPGGRFLLGDATYSFPVEEYQDWYRENMSNLESRVSPRFFEQIRTDLASEFMTFTWIVEGILERTGFTVENAKYPSEWYAEYMCRKAE